MAPTDLETARVAEGMLAILHAGGVGPQPAAWAVDALLLYVAAYCLETSIAQRRSSGADAVWVRGRDELMGRFAALPEDTFPPHHPARRRAHGG